MKNKISYLSTFICLFLTLIFNTYTHAQLLKITRGSEENEIYISTDWYMDNYGNVHYAIIHSTDNGENITLKYENIENPPTGEMQVGKVLGDATPGALYNYGSNGLWTSFDYGKNWDYLENYTYVRYVSGFINGEIYRRNDYNLYRSENYGQYYELIVESLSEPLSDVGVLPGELYGFTGSSGIGYKLYHTSNYGQYFTEIPIDSAVAFGQIGGYFPQISRGTEPEELYLISWWPDYHHKIFHSVDTGYTWTQKYESNYIDIYFWRVAYTAGREPGSFYVTRNRINPAGDHVWLYIDYSSDYGETFTTYFHDIDSTISSINSINKKAFKLTCFPNPFTEKTTISFELPENCKNPVLNIYNIYGIIIRQYILSGKKIQQWNGEDNNGMHVPNGIYIYNINYDNITSKYKKILLIN